MGCQIVASVAPDPHEHGVGIIGGCLDISAGIHLDLSGQFEFFIGS